MSKLLDNGLTEDQAYKAGQAISFMNQMGGYDYIQENCRFIVQNPKLSLGWIWEGLTIQQKCFIWQMAKFEEFKQGQKGYLMGERFTDHCEDAQKRMGAAFARCVEWCIRTLMAVQSIVEDHKAKAAA